MLQHFQIDLSPDTPKNDTCSALFLKNIYAGMLLEFSFEETRKFWDDHPLNSGQIRLSGIPLLELIWSDEAEVPIDYFLGVLRDFERYLEQKKINIDVFIIRILKSLNGSALVNTRLALKKSAMYIAKLLTSRDCRATILTEIIPLEITNLLQPMRFSIVDHSIDQSIYTTIAAIRWSDAEYRNFNVQVYTGNVLSIAPQNIGHDAYDKIEIICDMRLPSDVMNGEGDLSDNFFIINGKKVCRKGKLAEVFHLFNIDYQAKDSEDVRVYICEKDVRSPHTDRILLKKGCAYGAPATVLLVKYRAIGSKTDILSSIINDFINKDHSKWKQASQLHRTLIGKSSGLHVVYQTKSSKILINNKVIARGFPARILQHMFQEACRSGKTSFEHREFLRDLSITTVKVNHNLGIRLIRVFDLVARKVPEVSMQKKDRGIVEFIPKGVVEYTEKDA